MIKKGIATLLIGILVGGMVDNLTSGRRLRKMSRRTEEAAEKLQEFYTVLLRWLQIHQEGRSLDTYFKKNGYKTVAIYGMKELGEALLRELTDSEIKVKYAIDKGADNIFVGIDVCKPEEVVEPVDVVVVTAIHYFDEIEEELHNRMKCPIISIEDIVWES